MYRMQIYDERTTGMHWQVHKVGARQEAVLRTRRAHARCGHDLGGDPVYTFAATAPLPGRAG